MNCRTFWCDFPQKDLSIGPPSSQHGGSIPASFPKIGNKKKKLVDHHLPSPSKTGYSPFGARSKIIQNIMLKSYYIAGCRYPILSLVLTVWEFRTCMAKHFFWVGESVNHLKMDGFSTATSTYNIHWMCWKLRRNESEGIEWPPHPSCKLVYKAH